MLDIFDPIPVFLDEGRLLARLPDGNREAPIGDPTALRIAATLHGAPEWLVPLLPGRTWLLAMRLPDGKAEGWLLMAGARRAAPLHVEARRPERHAAWIETLGLGRQLRALAAAAFDPAQAAGEAARKALAGFRVLDWDIVQALSTMASPAGAARLARPAEAAALEPALRGDIAIADPAGALADWQRVLAAEEMRLPSVFRPGPAEAAVCVPLSLRPAAPAPLWLTRDAGRPCVRIPLPIRPAGRGCTWLPDTDLLVVPQEMTADLLPWVRGLVAHLCAMLAQLPDDAWRRLGPAPRRVALFLPGSSNAGPHLGHALWDELSCLDRAIDTMPPGVPPPPLYRATAACGSGAELFGPLEELYPEFAGRVATLDTPPALLARSLQDGRQLFQLANRGMRRKTRARVGRAAAAEAARQGLPDAAASVIGTGAARRPVIALGLRLMNRRPVDHEGFARRLLAALAARLGPLVVVLDGLNASESGPGSAAMIYSAGTLPGKELSTGVAEMAAEAAFAERLAAFADGIGVRVVSCVGMRMRPNLFWLSQAGFFVAPCGAGLAKLRWALDVPGFVLTGRANLQWLRMLTIYGDARWMEPPFAPLHYTAPEEVEDQPADPSLRPTRHFSIPWPDNFAFTDEAALIARICDLAEPHLRPRPSCQAR